MNSGRIPRIAKWLLRHLSSSPNIEAMIGDLDERYSQGRSPVWYWQQVFVAIYAGIATEVRAHKLHAVRVLVVGWLLLFPAFWLQTLGVWHLYFMSPQFWYPLTFIVSWPYTLLWWAGVGWLLARLHRPHERAMLMLLVLSLVPAFFLKVVAISRVLEPSWLQYLQIISGAILPLISLLVGGGMFRSRRHTQRRVSGA